MLLPSGSFPLPAPNGGTYSPPPKLAARRQSAAAHAPSEWPFDILGAQNTYSLPLRIICTPWKSWRIQSACGMMNFGSLPKHRRNGVNNSRFDGSENVTFSILPLRNFLGSGSYSPHPPKSVPGMPFAATSPKPRPGPV